jgi:hypothetical protein
MKKPFLTLLPFLSYLCPACHGDDGYRTREEALLGLDKFDPAEDPYPPELMGASASEFEPPVPLDGPVNTAGAEDSPFWVPGRGLYFFFTPDPKVPVEEQVLDGVTGIWWSGGATREAERVRLAESSGTSMDGCAAFEGGDLWFCSVREGNYNEIDWWIAACSGAECEAPVNAGRAVNVELRPGELHLVGGDLYFGSEREGGQGGLDLWRSTREGSAWSTPLNLGDRVNGADTEMMPFVSTDGLELWWTGVSRQGRPGPAVWRSRLVDGAWDEAEEILASFAGEPTLDDEGNVVFVHHYFTEGPGDMIEADLYLARRRR